MKDTAMTTDEPQPGEYSLTIRKPYFALMATGAKTIEVRVGYPKIRKIKPGDTLRITCADESLTTRITTVEEYDSFTAMLDAEDPTAIGGPDLTHDELVAAIHDIYPPEKEALGVFALHLALAQTGA
ncbi:ASCH domain-containing protein [Streptomyces sp. NPDC004752]